MQVRAKQWKDERRTRITLWAAFGGIAALLLASQIMAFFQWRSLQVTVAAVERNAATSVRLIGRMGVDIQRERSLIDRHIFEHEAARLAAIEEQIAGAKADYAAAAREYVPLITFENEPSTWFALTRDVATVEQQTTAALDRSRADRDAEAIQILATAEPAFDAISRGVKDLIEINQTAVDGSRTREAELEINLGLAAAVLLITLVVGRQLTRVISHKERQLGAQTIELENRNRELDAFAGRVAHDLRGPLHTISLAAALLAERVPDEAAAGGTAILQRGVTQVTSLVDDLLELSRADAPMTGAPARAESVAASVAADLGPRVSDAGGSLQVDVEPASIACSEGLLRQAVWNLGENAVKYRRPDVLPVITLVGRITRAGYELRVSDNGLGMSPDDARHAFEPFFRSKRTQEISGTGFGLAIVRRVVEASGGTVSIDSQLERGTTVVLRLPLAP